MEEKKPILQEISENVNAFIGGCQIISKLLTVFLRRPGSWGKRYAGFQMLASWLFCLVFTCFFPNDDARPLLGLWGFATMWLVVHRFIGAWWRPDVPSYYCGNPWLGGYGREVVFVFIAGLVAVQWDKPLGTYLVVSGFCLWISLAWQKSADDARMQAIIDARFEAENMRGGGW